MYFTAGRCVMRKKFETALPTLIGVTPDQGTAARLAELLNDDTVIEAIPNFSTGVLHVNGDSLCVKDCVSLYNLKCEIERKGRQDGE